MSRVSAFTSWATAHSSSAVSGRGACILIFDTSASPPRVSTCKTLRLGSANPVICCERVSGQRCLSRELGTARVACIGPIEQWIAEADHRSWRGAGPADATQGFQGRRGWQDSDRVLPCEPGDRTMIPRAWRHGDEHLEGQLRKRAGRHDQEVLALDQVLHLTEQRSVKLVGASLVKGQRLVGAGRLVERDAEGLGAFLSSAAVPRRRI